MEDKILDVDKLISELEKYRGYKLKLTVHRELSEAELDKVAYKYPYENIETALSIDDISHSDGIVCLGCDIR